MASWHLNSVPSLAACVDSEDVFTNIQPLLPSMMGFCWTIGTCLLQEIHPFNLNQYLRGT